MKEILDLYADLKVERDKLLADQTLIGKEYQALYDAVKGKVEVVNNGRIADLVIGYIKKLEDGQKPPAEHLSEEGMMELIRANGR